MRIHFTLPAQSSGQKNKDQKSLPVFKLDDLYSLNGILILSVYAVRKAKRDIEKGLPKEFEEIIPLLKIRSDYNK